MMLLLRRQVFDCGTSGNIAYIRRYSKFRDPIRLWDEIQDPNTTKDKTTQLFKKYLRETAKANQISIENPDLNRILDGLIPKAENNASRRDKSSIQRVKEIYNNIKNKSIQDDEIYQVISSVVKKDLYNIILPSKNTQSKKDHIKTKPKSADLKIHMSSHGKLNNIIDELKINQDGSGLSKNIGDPYDLNTKLDMKLEANENNNLNLNILKGYLEETEIKQKQLKKFSWEENKKYNWDTQSEKLNSISAGNFLFDNSSNRIVKKILRKSNFLVDKLPLFKYISNHIDSPTEEFLIYDLIKGKVLKKVKSDEDTSILININRQDLFAIINGSMLPPEEALKLITNIENKGWKLMGSTSHNSSDIIFQRNIDNTSTPVNNKGNKMYKIYSIIIATLGIGYWTSTIAFQTHADMANKQEG
ncbi:hypothetical protein Kpol_1072p6 [Vanderwaltozyma polyspora DSM 70294]|uniref:Uncharacterized protein n=1 Tax=Vanderwaltozyma polyspora (strain ATCC 22028 / DSM 70294 / BCRC 21397 / CBS 2163 / NBRC 10782 / NRRL Y-8283 / UCD 57-17) TaxID=436907 RepID=A7TKM4_VANPO|nr:uncharacterized protein Kpol_1072p6 [Vanderwaltozyma polyspora DSM 70294]EDO17136.1 hypothetical protein Kpol_1072p6 [Vanderwaltozyma polyspora DSM 70294]